MKLWIGDTSFCFTLVTFAETEEEARKKLDAFLSEQSDSVVTLTEYDGEVLHV